MLPETIRISRQEIQVEVLCIANSEEDDNNDDDEYVTVDTLDKILMTHVLSSLSQLSVQSQQPAEEAVEVVAVKPSQGPRAWELSLLYQFWWACFLQP